MKPEDQLQATAPTGAVTGNVVRDQDKVMLVLAYLGLLALIPLLTVNDSEFVKWHAKNGLVLWTISGLLADARLGPGFHRRNQQGAQGGTLADPAGIGYRRQVLVSRNS